MEEAGFSMLKDKIKDVLDTLTEREREVLEQRFGPQVTRERRLQPHARKEVGVSDRTEREAHPV
jgi:RNA polymerase primary sigma factor